MALKRKFAILRIKIIFIPTMANSRVEKSALKLYVCVTYTQKSTAASCITRSALAELLILLVFLFYHCFVYVLFYTLIYAFGCPERVSLLSIEHCFHIIILELNCEICFYC